MEVGSFMPKAFKLLAGGKRSATTGKGTRCGQHPGGMTACMPPGCFIRLEQFRWWRFAYHWLIVEIPPGYIPKQRKFGTSPKASVMNRLINRLSILAGNPQHAALSHVVAELAEHE